LKNTSKKIFIEQTRLLYANSVIPISVSIVAGAMLCWSLQSIIDQTVLVAWFIIFFVITLFRLFSVYLFNNGKTEQRDEEHWHRRFLICTYAVAAVWGAASFFLFPEHSLPHQTVFFIIILGMAAGGISSLCPSLPVVGGFLSLLLIPLIVKLLTLGDAEAVFNGSLLLIFWGVILIGAIKINENISENILLHIESVGREKILEVSEERYRHIFSNAPLGILHYDATGTIVDCNEAFINLLGSSRDLLIGMQMLVTLKDQKILSAINDSLADGEGYYEGDYISVTSNITTPIRAFFKAIKSSEEKIVGGVGVVEDFSEKKQSEQLIQYQASYDPLTGLPNRRLLLDHLSTEMARARRHGHYGALLFIDLDNFKTINDSLGHSVGDELLKVVAKRITECIREEDTAARMGGDEFIIIITELDITIGLAAYKLRGVAEQLSLSLSSPCQIAGHDLHITPSIGVSIFPTPNKGVDDVLKQADSAMYRAKAAGRNTIRFFLPHMQEAADERLHLNTELRKALDCNQFSLYYQPQVNMSRELIGAEALLRWHHPERGVIPNETFIDIAEETGLMPDIGQWVLREACQSIKKWTDAGQLGGSQTISINISGKEIATPGYVDRAVSVIEETGVNPNHLGIELTESSLVSTNEDIVDKIVKLRQIGIKFSIDDFGTGYSSLRYLKNLPLNTLKIDRSFVNDIKDGNQDVVLIDTIILMAHNLGLEVIAEGVETEQELHYLNTRGCTVYQGFRFSKPVVAETFTEMLKSGIVN
jgi:diguanylate cyclase (GGDEF)-like protein/PAS domain S-box-containing protein